MQGAVTKVFEMYPEVGIRVSVDGVKLHLRGQSTQLAQQTEDVLVIPNSEFGQIKLDLTLRKKKKE